MDIVMYDMGIVMIRTWLQGTGGSKRDIDDTLNGLTLTNPIENLLFG